MNIKTLSLSAALLIALLAHSPVALADSGIAAGGAVLSRPDLINSLPIGKPAAPGFVRLPPIVDFPRLPIIKPVKPPPSEFVPLPGIIGLPTRPIAKLFLPRDMSPIPGTGRLVILSPGNGPFSQDLLAQARTALAPGH